MYLPRCTGAGKASFRTTVFPSRGVDEKASTAFFCDNRAVSLLFLRFCWFIELRYNSLAFHSADVGLRPNKRDFYNYLIPSAVLLWAFVIGTF